MKNKYILTLSLIILFGACEKEKTTADDQPETNLEEINIVVDQTSVLEGQEIRFDIEGRADFLTFFSGEVGHNYHENPFSGVEHRGRIDYLRYLYSVPGEYDVFFLARDNAGNERTIGPYRITVLPDPNPMLATGTISGAPSVGVSLTAPFLFDLVSMKSYTYDEGTARQEEIDLLTIWSGAGFAAFFIPSGSMSGFGMGLQIMANWSVFNDGELFKLNSPTPEEVLAFEALERRDDLIAQYDLARQTVSTRPGYSLNNNGPGTRVNRMNPGYIVYYKSSSKDLYAAFRVISTDGSNGIQFEVKSILK